jgi:hypothetical protein
MRSLGSFVQKRGVVVFASSFWIETQVELVLPAEPEPRLRQGVVTQLCARPALCQV